MTFRGGVVTSTKRNTILASECIKIITIVTMLDIKDSSNWKNL